MKLYGYIDHQGTCTPQAGNEKGTGFLPFTGVSIKNMDWKNVLLRFVRSGERVFE